MKKILFVAPSLAVGGMERVLVALSNALAKREYDVTILLMNTKDDLRDELDPRIRLRIKQDKDHLGKKIPFIRHKLYDDGMWETRTSPKKLYEYYIGDETYDVEIAFFRGMLPLRGFITTFVRRRAIRTIFPICGRFLTLTAGLTRSSAYQRRQKTASVRSSATPTI